MDPMMILALLVKQYGGKVLIEEQTFSAISNDVEILVQRNMEGNVVLELIEEPELVAKLRKTREEQIAQQQARSKILVPKP